MRLKWTLALAITLTLAGCNGRRDDENAIDTNDANVMNVPEELPIETGPLNDSQTPPNADAAENKASPPQISDEQQIQDDADATGMTSRLPDETETPLPALDSAAKDHPSVDHGSGNVASLN